MRSRGFLDISSWCDIREVTVHKSQVVFSKAETTCGAPSTYVPNDDSTLPAPLQISRMGEICNQK